MSDRDATTVEHETAVKQLLKKAARRRRPSQVFSDVPHGRETDANREFAPHREPNGIVWFFLFLPAFVIAWAICVKMGAV
ncbi:hypothetical protein [Bradyrhizobium sp. CCGUVB23]|uniref:hypothetical protein n=1 Tax=Bradyrhizobium sp. CCGUVB23 TaxID=2949630 RepID=UPI0020B315DF|nr:hypothetical protein [Bradyrhizobium sp. CCGUVB23]MCP3459731.1 hypothetical protein [Bradyrhizobium sp. CCGUVB23]